MSEPMDTLDKRWRQTCRTLLKREVGPLEAYAPWLCENLAPLTRQPSSLSGQEVVSARPEPGLPGRFVALDEVPRLQPFPKLDLNQIKDIDSIASALSERVYYAGNIVLGKSEHVQASSNVSDSFYVLGSAWIDDSKYMAHCTRARHSEDCFGCHMAGESACLVKTNADFRNKRGLEVWNCQNSSDCYYTHRLESCNECLFSFNLYSKRYCIGNRALERGAYLNIKERLLAQMADELEAKKRLPTLVQMAGSLPAGKPAGGPWPAEKVQDRARILRTIGAEFARTCQVVLGRPLAGGMEHYEPWLTQHASQPIEASSAATGRPIRLIRFANFELLPAARLLKLEEGAQHGQRNQLDEGTVLSLDFKDAGAHLGPIAYFTPEVSEGTNIDLLECPAAFDSSSSCFRMAGPPVATKYAAYTHWTRRCESVFGGFTLFDCKSCLNCYSSVKLSRCLEVDSSRSSSDCYFCHNVENCEECMFCFNVKAKRYAIGNAEYPKEEYLRIKKLVLDEIGEKLEKDKKLGLSIYDVGGR